MCRCGWVGALLGLFVFPVASLAQDDVVLPSPGLALLVGTVSTDFAGSTQAGDGSMLGVRVDLPLGGWAVLEPTLERLSLDGTGATQTRWQVDFGVRAEFPLGPVRPFMGGALGALLWPSDDRPIEADFVVATYGGFAGLRYDITERIGVRGEARRRWLDGLESSTTTLGIGLGWRF